MKTNHQSTIYRTPKGYFWNEKTSVRESKKAYYAQFVNGRQVTKKLFEKAVKKIQTGEITKKELGKEVKYLLEKKLRKNNISNDNLISKVKYYDLIRLIERNETLDLLIKEPGDKIYKEQKLEEAIELSHQVIEASNLTLEDLYENNDDEEEQEEQIVSPIIEFEFELNLNANYLKLDLSNVYSIGDNEELYRRNYNEIKY